MHFIGIDVSKDTLDAACVTPGGEVVFEAKAVNNPLGFRKIAGLVARHAEGGPFRIGFESTGIHHLGLLRFCLDSGWDAVIINPILCAQATRLSVRPRKTDRIDASLIAELVMRGKGRKIGAFDLPRERRAVINAIDIYKECLQKLKGHRRNAVCVDGDIAKAVLASLDESIARTEKEVGALKRSLRLLENRETELLESLVGIGPFSAHKILDQIGSVARFGRPEQLVAFSGLEPRPIQSGTSINHHGGISKRGSGRLRHVVFQCAQVARIYDPELKAFFEKLRLRGLHHTAAVCAVARKLLLRIHAVLKRGTPYIPKPLTCGYS